MLCLSDRNSVGGPLGVPNQFSLGNAKGAPGLAFETWDPPSEGQSSPAAEVRFSRFAAWGSPTRQGKLSASMRHPPAAEALEQSHWRPLFCCARLPPLFASTAVAELPCQGLFCRRSPTVRIFSRVLLNRVLNDQYVHRAKVHHRIPSKALC